MQPLVEDAELAVSELVTNSVTAGCTQLWLSITIHREWARLRVFDDAPGLPRIVHAHASRLTGRGLAITAAISKGWGVDVQESGKQTWVDLSIPSAAGSTSAIWCLEPASSPA